MWRFGATDKPHGNTPIANNVRVYDRFINKKLYELTDQTGNVRVVITDRKRVNGSDEAKPDIAMSAQYYPYGMAQAGRVASAGADYRYGYNGMEEEDRGDAVSSEIASTGAKAKPGEANLLNTEFRLYDPRLGQWLTPDPVFQPWESPYSAMAGNPILFSDPHGDTPGTDNNNGHTDQLVPPEGGGGSPQTNPQALGGQQSINESNGALTTNGTSGMITKNNKNSNSSKNLIAVSSVTPNITHVDPLKSGYITEELLSPQELNINKIIKQISYEEINNIDRKAPSSIDGVLVFHNYNVLVIPKNVRQRADNSYVFSRTNVSIIC